MSLTFFVFFVSVLCLFNEAAFGQIDIRLTEAKIALSNSDFKSAHEILSEISLAELAQNPVYQSLYILYKAKAFEMQTQALYNSMISEKSFTKNKDSVLQPLDSAISYYSRYSLMFEDYPEFKTIIAQLSYQRRKIITLITESEQNELQEKNQAGLYLINELDLRKPNISTIKKYILLGADINTKGNKGFSVLMVTLQINVTVTFEKEWLKSNGYIKPWAEYTSIEYDEMKDKYINEFIEYLLKRKVNINDKDADGMTPFLLLARQGGGKRSLMKLLKENGAEVNAKNASGQCALDFTEGPWYNPNLREFLVSIGCKDNDVDDNNEKGNRKIKK